MKLKCIIFDVDGTMADTERDGHRLAFNLAFKENNLDWHWDVELYGKLLAVTGGKERMQYYQNDFLHNEILSADEIKNLHANKTKHYINLLKSGKIPLRKGVKRLIEQAQKNGITLAIATTTTPVNVTTLLKANLGENSEKLFKVIAAGDIVTHKKPAPNIYYYALKQLNINANECLAIEDSEAGLESAVNANIKTIVITNKYTQNQNFSKAALVFPDFTQINTQLLISTLGTQHV